MNWENKFWGTYTDYELDIIVNDDSLLDAYRHRAEQEQLKRFKNQ